MAIISKVETAFKSICEQDKSELNSLIKQQRGECSRERGRGDGVSIPCATISETSPACLALPSRSSHSLSLSPSAARNYINWLQFIVPQVVLAAMGERGSRGRRVPDTHTHTRTHTDSECDGDCSGKQPFSCYPWNSTMPGGGCKFLTHRHTRRAIKSCRGKITKKEKRREAE